MSKWIFSSIAVLCVVFAGWNLLLIWTHGADAPCTLIDNEPLLHGLVDRGWYLVGALTALGFGRVVSRSYGVPPFYTSSLMTMGYPPHSQDAVQFQQKERAALWVQVLIVILLSAALVGLSYETIGVSHDNDPWPLTFLIRCLNEGSAAHLTSYWAFGVTLAFAFIIGNWFWPEPAAPGSAPATPTPSMRPPAGPSGTTNAG